MRSSALVEDRFGSSFAGQFESYLGLDDEADFLTAVRACWAALWSTRAPLHGDPRLDPADTAMAVLVQPLVAARASGGGLSQTADGEMLISATWGLGSAIAQGEVVPDRFVLVAPGRPAHGRRRPQGSSRRLRPWLRRRPAGGAARSSASRASMPDRR